MLISASPINLTVQQGIERAKGSLNQRSLFDMLRQARVIAPIREEDIVLLYIPYHMAATINRIAGKREINAIVATDGITGESGVVMGKPVFDTVEIADDLICPSRIGEELALQKNLEHSGLAVMNRKRTLPETELFAAETIYKPTYVVPMAYSFGKQQRFLWRFVDAESGCVVYRYDVIWRSFPQLNRAEQAAVGS